MATAVEVQQGSLRSCGGVVALGLGVADGLDGGVVAIDVRLVVLGVVQLHDLARDVRLQSAIVVCEEDTLVSLHKFGSRGIRVDRVSYRAGRAE